RPLAAGRHAATAEPTQPQGQREEYHAEDDRVQGDEEHHGERAGAGPDDQQDPEQHGQHPAEREYPFAVDLPPEPDRRDDFQYAGDERPGGDQPEEDQRGDARPGEGQDADDDAGDAFDDEPAAAPAAVAAAEDGGTQG